MTNYEPMAARLHDLARKTEQRVGNHPEADLCRDAAKYITDLEAQIDALTVQANPEPAKAGRPRKA